MSTGSKAREMLNYTFLTALANDGIIDDSELIYIKSLALADGVLEEDEKRVLKRIFLLVDETKLSAIVRTEFQKFRAQYNL